MKKIYFIVALLFIMLCFGEKSYSQVGASYYISDIYAVNARLFNISNTDISAELKVFTNEPNIDAELDVLFRFAKGKYHKVGIGLGLKLGVDYENSQYLIPIVIEVAPFQNARRMSFVLEVAPGMESESDDHFIRGLLGFRYTFLKNKSENEE